MVQLEMPTDEYFKSVKLMTPEEYEKYSEEH
jgi:hypothetical protein